MIGVSSCGRLVVYIYAYVYIHVMGSQLPGRLICVRTRTDGCMHGQSASWLSHLCSHVRMVVCMHVRVLAYLKISTRISISEDLKGRSEVKVG